jgi:hypothetical protein
MEHTFIVMESSYYGFLGHGHGHGHGHVYGPRIQGQALALFDIPTEPSAWGELRIRRDASNVKLGADGGPADAAETGAWLASLPRRVAVTTSTRSA